MNIIKNKSQNILNKIKETKNIYINFYKLKKELKKDKISLMDFEKATDNAKNFVAHDKEINKLKYMKIINLTILTIMVVFSVEFAPILMDSVRKNFYLIESVTIENIYQQFSTYAYNVISGMLTNSLENKTIVASGIAFLMTVATKVSLYIKHIINKETEKRKTALNILESKTLDIVEPYKYIISQYKSK